MNNNYTVKTRSSNFELLRIVSMLMIVAHHYGVHGIMRNFSSNDLNYNMWLNASTSMQLFTESLVPLGQIGVGIFFVLTGYFLINKERKIVKLGCLLGQIYIASFFMLFTFILAKIARFYSFPEYSGVDSYLGLIGRSILPVSTGEWWFITVYALVFLISPLLNKIPENLQERKFKVFLVVYGIVWYLAGSFDFYVYEEFFRGIFFYFIGTYLRLYSKRIQLLKKIIIINILVLIALFFFDTFLMHVLFHNIGNSLLSTIKRSLCSLTMRLLVVPLSVIMIFNTFKFMTIKNTSKIGRGINAVSSTTLGVYLLHESEIGRILIWKKLLNPVNYIEYDFFIARSIIYILVLYLVCSFLGYILKKIIDKIMKVIFKNKRISVEEENVKS